MELSIKRFNQVKRLNEIVTNNKMFSTSDVFVCDSFGSKADARSLLGLMSLNYVKPVNICCENNLANYIIEEINNS